MSNENIKLEFLHDLGMDETAYGLAAGSFYLGYILFGVPVNVALGKIGARKTLLLIMMLWGLLWGGIGLLLAIPITAGLEAVCDHVEGLEPYGKLLGD